jgi:toxin ParE1/3/4
VRVNWLQAARANLIAVSEYISQDNPDAAARTVAAIVKAVESLEHFPALGRPGRISGTRELVVSGTPYIVPYRVRGEVVQLIRVFHAARRMAQPFLKHRGRQIKMRTETY